jgi:hypothetical protein
MERSQLLELLPCYLCGDLPPEAMEQVRLALEADPEALVALGGLRRVQEHCAESLMQGPPPELKWEEPAPAPSTIGRPWAALAAVAVAVFALGVFLLPSLSSPVGALVEVSAVHEAEPLSHGSFIAARDARQLEKAFESQGLDPMMAMVADLSHLELQLVGGHVVGNGTVVVYVDDAGRNFECHMAMDAPSGEPNRVLSADGQPDLEVYGMGDATAVVWREHGMICVLVSEHHALVVALARAKVWKV